MQRPVRLAAASQETGKPLLHLGGARRGENKLAKQSPARLMLGDAGDAGGRGGGKTGGARTTTWKFAPATKRRVRRRQICCCFGAAQDRGVGFGCRAPGCFRIQTRAWHHVKTKSRTMRTALHLDKGDFLVHGSNGTSLCLAFFVCLFISRQFGSDSRLLPGS